MAYSPPRDPTNVVGRRVVAYILDVILLSAIVVAVLAATRSNSFTGAPPHACDIVREAPNSSGSCVQFGTRVYTWDDNGVSVAVVVGLAVWVANLVVLQGLTGASIGKMITGLRTVNAEGQVCGIGRAFVRSVLLIVDSLFCSLVGLISVLSTHPHKRVGDMVARTFVVGASDAGTPIGVARPSPGYAYAAAASPSPWDAAASPGPPGWGTNPPPAPGWGTPPAAADQQPPAWGATPTPPQTGWGAPAVAPPPPGSAAPASHWAPSQPTAEPEPPAPPAPAAPSWAQPPPAPQAPPPPPPPAPEPEPPATEPEPPATEEEPPQAEEWWNRPGG